MSLAHALSAYTALNAAIVAACIALAIVETLSRRGSSRTLLNLHYCVAALVPISIFIASMLPQRGVFQPAAKLWAAQSMESLSIDYSPSAAPGYLEFGSSAAAFDAASIGAMWIAAALVLFAFGASKLICDVRALVAIRRRAHLARRIGRVRVWLSDAAEIPFSYWMGSAHVVIPTSLVEKPDVYRIVLAHELQHHRQRDTVWLYAFWAMRLVCIVNPFAHLWSSKVARIQEFACDEAVLIHRKWTVNAYAQCLFEVASSAAQVRRHYACATQLIGVKDRHTLKRRMEKMLQPRSTTLARSTVLAMAVAFVALLTATGYAASGSVQDRRVTLEQAQKMAASVPPSEGFSVAVNEEVLKELNRYAGTAEGRQFMRESLQRLNAYRGIVSTTLDRYDAPAVLMAVPLVESGYRNLDQSHNRLQGAGLWQFIPKTARAYGLRVDAQTDERLDPERLTDAAVRMLQAERLRFDDWQLALMAYNMGNTHVQEAIDSAGSRDAWTLVRTGHWSDEGYLARFHAAVLIMANPGTIE